MEHCPGCGKYPDEHDDIACEFRYFHDTANHDWGWIPPANFNPDDLLKEE